MRSGIYILVIIFWSCVANAQQGSDWAGPDKLSCGEEGVSIGIGSDPCPDCCYNWTPAEGLSCTDCKNPVAKPQTKTKYTVTVVDQHLRWKETDDMVVDLTFGEMNFTPDHLEQGTEDLVTARLLKNLNNDPITWDFGSADLGCMIDPMGAFEASIRPGTQYGEVIITASNDNEPGCIVKKTLPINNGVKDVWAIDPDSPNRIAKNGQTLYVFGQEAVIIRAIPNEGGFANGNPDWKEDSHGSVTPTDGQETNIMSEGHTVLGNESDYIAGEDPDFMPQTKVIRKTNVTTEQDVIAGVTALMNLIKDKLKFKGSGSTDAPDIPCASPDPFKIDAATTSFKIKTTEVEKWNSPASATKFEAAFDATYGVTGKLYHPQFTRNVYIPGFGIDVCSQLYASAGSSVSVAFNLAKDPSKENDDWLPINIQGKFGIKLGSGFVLTVVSPLYAASGSAEFSISLESVAEYQAVDNKLVSYISISPATCAISSTVYKVTDIGQYKKVFVGPSAKIQIISGFKSDPVTIYDFN